MSKLGIGLLTDWLEKKGYEVDFEARDSYIDSVNKEVGISYCRTPLQTMYTLAHEAGHLVLYKGKNYSVNYRSVIHAETKDARHSKSRLYRYKKLQEEILAWSEGYKLMLRLGIKVNKNAYDLYSAKWINTYIQFFANTKKSIL